MRLTEAQSQGRVGRSVLHADKGYDAIAIRRQVEERGATPNIPPKTNRKWKTCFSPFLYRNRNAIERMFRRLEDFRRVATRYDRNAANFPAAACIAAAVSYRLCVRTLESPIPDRADCAWNRAMSGDDDDRQTRVETFQTPQSDFRR